MKLRDKTARIQENLGFYCRTGEKISIPGVTPGRLHHYRRLVNNAVRDSLDSAFPISVAALGEATWDLLVQDFFTYGQPGSPSIWKMPFEFYRYHAGRETGSRMHIPYLEDLLYFEWMEIEVYNMPDRIFPHFISSGDLLKDRVVFNPEYEIVRLEYPVHMHRAKEAAGMRGEYFVLIVRVPSSGNVRFFNLSAINAYIVTRLDEEDIPVSHMKGDISQMTGIDSEKYLDESLEKFISDLMQKGLILGFNGKKAGASSH